MFEHAAINRSVTMLKSVTVGKWQHINTMFKLDFHEGI